MSDYTIRPWQPGDEAALIELWKTGFGDDEDYIRNFHARFLNIDACLVAECDGKPVSAMYILDGITLFPFRRNTLSAAYTYALATLPEYRGRGIGTAVYRACCEAIWNRGIDAACVLPAEESLYPFYQNATHARPVCAVRETHYTAAELKAVTPTRCIRVGGAEYAAMRSGFLANEAHADMNDDFCLWQEENTDRFGGGMFMLVGGLASAVMEGSRCVIQELLMPNGDEKAAAAAVAAFCPAGEYTVRAPAYWDGDGTVRPTVLASFRSEPKFFVPDDLWWGFAFD